MVPFVVQKMLIITGLLLPLISAQAEQRARQRKADIYTQPVAGNIYVLRGVKGGNVGLFIGEDGTFMIDDQFASRTDSIQAAIQAAGGRSPDYLLNTHYHGDNTGGNQHFGKAGALIVSHDNVRKKLNSGFFIKVFNKQQEPEAKIALPIITFSNSISFHLNGDTVYVFHVPNAHTDGDVVIQFKAANVIHTGDIFFNGFYPFIDVYHGGSLKGMIDAVDRILTLTNIDTRIIPGHGPLADEALLKNYRAMLVKAYAQLKKLKDAGTSVQEAVAKKPLADLELQWGNGIYSGAEWIRQVYPSIK
ncbi:MAG: cyclase [Moritella sp.]|jgi:cyclase